MELKVLIIMCNMFSKVLSYEHMELLLKNLHIDNKERDMMTQENLRPLPSLCDL